MPSAPSAPIWIELDGAANVRDLGGLPLTNGSVTVARRLIRSDNLQGLSPDDIRRLVDRYGLRSVVDLRTDTEVVSEGDGPLTAEPGIQFLRASLFNESENTSDNESDDESDDNPGQESSQRLEVVGTDDGPVVLPWHNRPRSDGDRAAAAAIYLSYLTQRPDSIIAGLRLIAHGDGATLVHCAAGKDRTGVLIAMALDAVGVERAAIVEDFARTGERLPALLARLAASPTYAQDITVDQPERHHPRPETMQEFFAGLELEHGGTAAWLAAHGWTVEDQAALQAKLTTS